MRRCSGGSVVGGSVLDIRTEGMAVAVDQSRAGVADRDIELAITALKKGAQLLKYGRRGKPKICPFRLAHDESTMIWFSGKEEKRLKLSHVSRIIPGQRTPTFQRYPQPEKEYQSFSLIYSDGSLDLICKDKDEAEVWFTGLKALISRCHQRKGRSDSRSDGISSEATSPRAYTQRSSPLSSPFGSVDGSQKDGIDATRFHTPYGSPKHGLEKALSDAMLYSVNPKVLYPSESTCGSVHSVSSAGSDGKQVQSNVVNGDAFRVSLSSAVSSSSQGSGLYDGDALGDIFIWGEGTGEGILGGGMHKIVNGRSLKMDSLFPKVLESAVALDVQNIACGGKHAALVTKQGEVFTWGEEFGGRLGHGVDSDVSHPKLVDYLKGINVELVACGEYHSCAVTLSGELYTWGGNSCNFGLLGHGNGKSQWIPKKLSGPLDGIHISSVSCGLWHTAVVTSAGQLFTFGDGTFGTLGHGNRESVSIPREVESLKGLRIVRAACGVWHTAAVVEVMVGSSSSSNYSSGKLFTWGDGDKGRLGHGDKEARLVPTCVPALVEHNFCQVACGHSLTVALTTTGHVYTMGNPLYGQLGHPKADGRTPILVEGKLTKNFVEEISCGAYHVAALTSRTEVYTWGKGTNGRLGQGDTDDRNSPTLIEFLKDKQVKSVVCGANFTAAVCLHKSISCIDQSKCSGCQLPFNFKRKRHNCYNCGLVFCHSCSSKKSLKASMAPNPNKSYRVCDNCFTKLVKGPETGSSTHSGLSRRGSINQGGVNVEVEKSEKSDLQTHGQLSRNASMESSKELNGVSMNRNKKLDHSSIRVLPLPADQVSHANINYSKTANALFGSSKKFLSVSLPGSRIVSRATSPTSRRSSPPRAATPTQNLAGFASTKIAPDDAKRTNDNLSGEVVKLKTQVEELTCKLELREVELDKATRQLKEAISVAAEETRKCKAAKEVIKSLTAQLKDMAEKLPLGAVRSSNSPTFSYPSSTPPRDVSSVASEHLNDINCHQVDSNGSSQLVSSNGSETGNNFPSLQSESVPLETATKNRNKPAKADPAYGDEWIEQDEPGVYITLVALPGGLKDIKRVRFSRKRFSEKQAEQWWAANKARVYQRYNVPMVEKPNVAAATAREGITH